jgi:serine/threonine-protein kinase RsbW
VLTELFVTVDCQTSVLLALTEACNNVILHATGEDDYEVHVAITEDDCQIRVIDAGQGFHPSTSEHLGRATTDESGRGIALMRALVDTIDFDSRPEAGTIVHLVKRLDFDGQSPLRRTP